MSLTVESCMNRPAFRCAKIVAGRGGIGQSVNSITVLEYADVSVISSDLFLNHEMCITAFASIKNDVAAQCSVIRRMKEIGICAVVLYYVGIFVPYLDERLIKTADEVNLPLICMPFNRFDFRYGEAINDVMYALLRSKEEDLNFIPEILESVSELPERMRTIRSVLQIISDRFHCSFFLLSQKGDLVSEGQWPQSADWDYQKIAELFLREQDTAVSMRQEPMELDQKEVYVTYSIVVPDHNPQLHLFAVDEQKSVTYDQICRAAELVALFMNISNYTLEETTPEMIIRSIISNEPLRMREIAAKHGIDLGKIQNMWVICGNRSSSDYEQKRALRQAVSEVRHFFRRKGKWALADLYHNSIIILFNAAAFAELDVELETELMDGLAAGGYRLNLIKCSNIASAQSLRDDYQLIESYFDAAQLIYPERSVFDLYDLHFAERLKGMTDQEGPALSQKMFALQPIRQCGNHSTLLETLAVYLLDADKNLQRASEILNVHKNTVRYRIKQIRDSYTCDITQMPLASELYEEVALQRLLHNSN